jgi:tRNA uridine 5-carbamoylmethylation protein Kti12
MANPNFVFNTVEGMDNNIDDDNSAIKYIEPPGQTDPAYISRVNSSNISFLKSQIDGIQLIKQQILETNNNVKKNTTDITELQIGLKELGKSMSTGLNNKMEDATGINPESKKALPAVI